MPRAGNASELVPPIENSANFSPFVSDEGFFAPDVDTLLRPACVGAAAREGFPLLSFAPRVNPCRSSLVCPLFTVGLSSILVGCTVRGFPPLLTGADQPSSSAMVGLSVEPTLLYLFTISPSVIYLAPRKIDLLPEM